MKTVLITGGTGFVGKHLTQLLLQNNYGVIILTRNKNIARKKTSTLLSYAYWNVDENIIDENAIAKADYIVHLAGAGIAEKRWTEKRKKEIVDSRVNSSKLLVKSLVKTSNKIQAVISASAIGWYDSSLNKIHTEEETPANDFLGNTCKIWEESIEPVQSYGIRLVKLRLGIVLSRDGGMLKKLLKPLQLRIVPVFGSGKQFISWIHIDDLCRMFLFAIENDFVKDVYNAVAPNLVAQKHLITVLAKQKQGNKFLKIFIPAFILKLMLGEMSIEVLKSLNVSAGKILAERFDFYFDDIERAIKNIIS